MYFLDFDGGWPGSDAVEFYRVHGQLTGFHDHSEVFDFRNVELGFLELQVKVELGHALEDTAGSFCVGLGVGGGNEEVIHIDDEPSFSDHISEGVIYESLECGGRVTKAKEHDGGFEEPFVGDEGCLPLVTILDADIVVPLTNVEFGEVTNVFQLVYKVGDEREEICIMGGVFVKVLVVIAGVEFAVLLFDEEEGGCLG